MVPRRPRWGALEEELFPDPCAYANRTTRVLKAAATPDAERSIAGCADALVERVTALGAHDKARRSRISTGPDKSRMSAASSFINPASALTSTATSPARGMADSLCVCRTLAVLAVPGLLTHIARTRGRAVRRRRSQQQGLCRCRSWGGTRPVAPQRSRRPRRSAGRSALPVGSGYLRCQSPGRGLCSAFPEHACRWHQMPSGAYTTSNPSFKGREIEVIGCS